MDFVVNRGGGGGGRGGGSEVWNRVYMIAPQKDFLGPLFKKAW